MKNNSSGMSLIVKTITRLTVGLIIIYGIYIVLRGHISPGGGFAGGVIIALSFIHLMLAFGKEVLTKKLGESRDILLASVGAGLFIILSAIGFTRGGNSSASQSHFGIFDAGFIPLYDIAIALMVGLGLYLLFLALVLSSETRGKE